MIRQRNAAVADIDDAELLSAIYDFAPGAVATRPDFVGGLNFAHPVINALLSGGLRFNGLFTAARDLAAIIESADFDGLAGARGFAFDFDTPYGRVILQDSRAQTLETEVQLLLVIDTGGDDIYRAPVGSAQDLGNPAAVHIDLGGDDRYGFEGDDAVPEIPELAPADGAGRYDGSHPDVGDAIGPMSLSYVKRQGSAVLGVGFLFDFAGNDIYLSHKLSQGAAVLGVGALRDVAGDDRYLCEEACQGAGSHGIGVLLDEAGSDRYTIVTKGQGFGYLRAFGYLHDERGNDEYLALLGDPALGGTLFFASAQNSLSNSSLAQGVGFGRRADVELGGDGVFGSGGVGVLRDGNGHDRYTVDIFGQATGFWFGTGILSDGAGNDHYDGRWYNQGSGAHFSMSFFFEEGGDDEYNQNIPILATAVGQGHDLTLGYLVDFSGDDVYTAPGLGLGGGNDNGMGFFLEGGGRDSYDAPDGSTYGGAAIGDRGDFNNEICLGVFVDSEGQDDYSRFPEPDAVIGNDREWTWDERRPEHRPGERGAGIDVDEGELVLPFEDPVGPAPDGGYDPEPDAGERDAAVDAARDAENDA